jgi:hypothetical protein
MHSNRDTAYHATLKLAQTALLQRDLEERCRAAGATWKRKDQEVVVSVPYFLDTCDIFLPDYRCVVRGKEGAPSLSSQILLLHYLAGVQSLPLTGKPISFLEVPSGSFYYDAFVRRAIAPLVRTYGHDPEALAAAARTLGGAMVAMGDLAVSLPVFPRVPVTLVYWRGDEEFPPDLYLLFDATIVEFLSTEDIAVLGQELMLRMLRQSRS